MKYKCSCGEISYIRWNSFKKGCRCKKCSSEKLRKFHKLTYEFVKEEFFKRNFILLEKEYIDCTTKMNYICSCGRKSKITWDAFKIGCSCRKCGTERQIKKRKFSYEYIKSKFEEDGCKLLEEEYINSKIKMKYICNCGNISFINWANFSHGRRCKKCAIERTRKAVMLSYKYIKSQFKKAGCKLLEKEYIGSGIKMKYICSCGNISYISWANFSKGRRCKKCSYLSKGENNIEKFLKKYNIMFEKQKKIDNCKNQYPLPFDFYIIKNNILIEYDGEHHFKPVIYGNKKFIENVKKAKNRFNELKKRDSIKTKFCEDNNIKLIRIPYWEFRNIDKILEKELV